MTRRSAPARILARGLACLTAAWLTGTACVPDAGRADRTAGDYLRLLAAEDARPADGPQLSLLVTATTRRQPILRSAAVRALGRLERPELLPRIAGLLPDPSATVRATAALAVAQAVHGEDGGTALPLLLDRVGRESHPAVRGSLAWALGRLSLPVADRERALEAMLTLAGPSSGGGGAAADGSPELLVGVALGLEATIRGQGEQGVSLQAATRLEEMLVHRRDDLGDVDAARIRALAASALTGARRMRLELVLVALEDPDAEVRRLAVRALEAVVPSRRPDLLRRAMRDSSDRVRIEAVRFLAARTRTEETCAMLVEAARPSSPTTVRVEALGALATPCPGTEQSRVLADAVAALGDGEAWQVATQAIRSLARTDPAAARRHLGVFVDHEDRFVRAHAAHAAATLRERRVLGPLSYDVSPNVRAAAVQGLFSLDGHAIGPLLRAQLEGDDPQLILTVAELLEGSPDASASGNAAVAAFERLAAQRRETLRDPRRALLERVGELGDATHVARLEPYLRDHDPVIAQDVARVLQGWTGETHAPASVALARAPLPSADELATLERTTVTLHVRGLGRVVIRPLPHLALTNASRFVRLAERGFYDGLTFHRRAANFVVQGGSPGANEYAGDGPFTRDEIGEVAHWRGTVGSSTRGRDTGDGQFFVNLVHNVRLDPDYTVFGIVVEGMDVVDRVLEGAVIERAEVQIGS